jgi:hypothetical protein
MLIAGDIGGTKTDLAIYSKESGPQTVGFEASPVMYCSSMFRLSVP